MTDHRGGHDGDDGGGGGGGRAPVEAPYPPPPLPDHAAPAPPDAPFPGVWGVGPAPIGPDGLPLWGEGALASISKRAAGRILDNVLFGIAFLIVATSRGWITMGDKVDLAHLPWWGPVLPVVAQAVYECVLYVWCGRTLGKWVAGTRVELGDGRLPGWHQAALRAMLPMLASIVPFLPGLLTLVVFLIALTNPLRQGLHDRAAGTIVVNAARATRTRPA